MVRIFLVIVAMATCLDSYPTGAPEGACTEMIPGHAPTTTSGSPPYTINITSTQYTPGSTIQGILYSTTGVLFRGFLLQARAVNDVTKETLGTFVGNQTITQNVCGKDNKHGLTHVNSRHKSNISFTWTAPDVDVGDIHFRLTIVESFEPSRFWLEIYSDVITLSSNGSITSESPMTNIHTEPVTTISTPVTTITIPTTTSEHGNISPDPSCGKTKGCFAVCNAKSCDFLVTWEHDTRKTGFEDDIPAYVTFDIQMNVKQASDIWVAIGLSPEGKMDKTNVAACLSQNSVISVQSSHNSGYSNEGFENATLGLTLINGDLSDGIFRCRFKRRTSTNHAFFYNLNDTYYLLVGSGPVSDGVMQQHFSTPIKSSSKINFLDTGVSGEDDSASTMVKIHATLMSVAWVFLSSVGIVVARHCKVILPSVQISHIQAWFHIHRTAMFLTFLTVIAGIVVIFNERGGFRTISTTDADKEYTKAHPYMGLVVGCLTFLNPIMALFRPKPDGKYRYIFNWAHFSVGTSAHLLAIVTIFFGIGLDQARLSDTHAVYVMIAYAATFVLVEFIMEIYNRFLAHRNNPLALKNSFISSGGSNTNGYASLSHEESLNKHNKRSLFREKMLFCHVVLMLALTVYLILIIWQPSKFKSNE